MRIGKQGDIVEVYLKISGSNRTERILGCGAKSVAHPLLNWAFQQKRLVRINTNGSGCLGNVLIPR